MLAAKCDKNAALRFFKKAIQTNCIPQKVNIDKSGSNPAALNQLNTEGSDIKVTRAKYVNNIIEQDHRRVKSKMRQAKGFGEFHSAHAIIKGVELCHMLKKRSTH